MITRLAVECAPGLGRLLRNAEFDHLVWKSRERAENGSIVLEACWLNDIRRRQRTLEKFGDAH